MSNYYKVEGGKSKPAGNEAWAAWSGRVYAEPGWTNRKKRYHRSRWLPHRCVWCRLAAGLQLNHLTYLLVHPLDSWALKALLGSREPGWTPWFTLLPMCARCHTWETWMTRKLRRILPRRGDLIAHAFVTLGVWALTRTAAVVAAWQAGVFAGWWG